MKMTIKMMKKMNFIKMWKHNGRIFNSSPCNGNVEI